MFGFKACKITIMCVNNIFNISRESVGLEPFIKKVDPTNSNHQIKNSSLKIKECQKYLEMCEEQIKNAIKIGVLKSVTVSEVLYICINSILEVEKDISLREKIIDEDELTTNIAAEMLGLTTKNVRRLIDEGYLTVVGNLEFKYGLANLVKKGEVKKLIPQIEEIKEFWKKQAKINRQMGAKKAVATRKTGINHSLTFKDHFLKQIENLPYKQSKLIRACISIVALDYYIERKMNKRIIDEEMIDLKDNSIKKLIELYNNSEYVHTVYIQGHEPYYHYCGNCLELIKEFRSSMYVPWSDIRGFFRPCKNCNIDIDYYSVVNINVDILNYEFNLYTSYTNISEWFNKNKYPCEIPQRLNYFKDDHMFIDKLHIPTTEIKSFKIFEAVDYLKEFINSKDLSLNL